jgi:hypothetical protein
MTSRFYFDFALPSHSILNRATNNAHLDTDHIDASPTRWNKRQSGAWKRSISIFLLITRASFYFLRLRIGALDCDGNGCRVARVPRALATCRLPRLICPNAARNNRSIAGVDQRRVPGQVKIQFQPGPSIAHSWWRAQL